jgi:hypothetical protein
MVSAGGRKRADVILADITVRRNSARFCCILNPNYSVEASYISPGKG